MMHHPSCPPGAHVHPVDTPVNLLAGHVVHVDRGLVAITHSKPLADRIAELINTHGLADIPDHAPDWRLPEHPDT